MSSSRSGALLLAGLALLLVAASVNCNSIVGQSFAQKADDAAFGQARQGNLQPSPPPPSPPSFPSIQTGTSTCSKWYTTVSSAQSCYSVQTLKGVPSQEIMQHNNAICAKYYAVRPVGTVLCVDTVKVASTGHRRAQLLEATVAMVSQGQAKMLRGGSSNKN